VGLQPPQLHAVENESERQVVAAGRPVLVQTGVEAMPFDEVPVDLPQRRSPFYDPEKLRPRS
jgi:hypothetical protein